MSDVKADAKAIFLQALEHQTPDELNLFLDEACCDTALRAHVEELLQAHKDAGNFLGGPQPIDATQDEPRAERPGTLIGPYKLLEQIGEGGMGLVFVAEQHEPIKRRVALKVIKPGMDSRQVIARFEAERQALALMDHPHIAKVFDGGATAEGRPYFVMELVKGTPITEYCDNHRLTMRQRLALFLDVCQAVQHAHQKGIIHRDIKPSNVLVEVHDVEPVVKVIDFGIAKAMGQQLTEKTVYTGAAQLVGTPMYMSPEQAGLSSLDVDTRSDVYSLGVLLYELLTGMTPFDSATFKKASYDEMRRIVREDEPPRPSTRLSTIKQAELSTIAERRGLEPRRLSQQLRGELDWIVMKALEKDRNRRYETASAFAADVRSYLSDEPVQACPPSKLYRMRKFARRHKAGLGVAAALLLVVLLGGSSSLWWLQKRAGAVGEARVAIQEAKDYLEAERWSEALSAARRAVGVLDSVGADAGLRQEVAALIKDQEMGRDLQEVQWPKLPVQNDKSNWEAKVGAYADAFQTYGLDVDGLDPDVVAAQIRTRPIHRQLVAALDDWAILLRNRKLDGWRQRLALARAADPDARRNRLRDMMVGKDPKAVEELAMTNGAEEWPVETLVLLGRLAISYQMPSAERVIVLLKRAQQRHPSDFWINLTLVVILEVLHPQHLEEELRYASIAVALQPQSAGAHVILGRVLYVKGQREEGLAEIHEAIRLNPCDAMAHNNLGSALNDQGQLDAAIAEFREAIRLEKGLALAHCNLGGALHAKGRLGEALDVLREAIRLEKDYAEAHSNLGVVLLHKGQLDEAIAEFREAIRLKKDFAPAHCHLGGALRRRGQLEEAITEYREAIRLDKGYAEAHHNLGDALRIKGQLDRAIAEFREAIRLKKDFVKAHHTLGLALVEKGQLDEAIVECREAIRLKKDDADAHLILGTALAKKGQLDGAITAFREAIRLNKDDAYAHCNLGLALREKGQYQEAVEELRLGHQLGSRNPRWPYPSAQKLRLTERLLALDQKLSAVLEGKKKPADVGERLDFAQICQMHRKRHAAAVRFYSEAFEMQKDLAEDREHLLRYNAACSAALAGCGQGKDAPAEDAERARLRQKALEWLRADLKTESELLKSWWPGKADEARKRLKHWLDDSDFNGVRGAAALNKLPQAERQAWQQLWSDVADTLARSQDKTAAKKKPDTK
jgi:serine/threonine protein kinase/tetratricopeptide (TPR) repeat protein